MNARKTRSGKSAYVMLLIGAVIGAVTFASIQSGKVISPAQAEKPPVAMPASNLEAPKLDMLRSLDEAFASIVDYASKAVVHIRTGGDRSQGLTSAMASGEGSGVIFRSDGYIVTNAHVVDSFDTVTVTLNDGRSFPGKVIKAEDIDIAVVKIQASDLPTVQFGNSDAVRPGQFAIAVGSPFGFENSTTIGHISAIGRESIVPDMRQGSARFYPDLIQTDASINMGNSGGPLLNVDGQVVGINTAIYSGTGGSVGIGFAIPSNQARMIADMLIEKGKVTRAYIGVRPVNLKEFQKKELGVEGGAVVDEIPNDGPASKAGLKQGDIIIQIGSMPIRTQQDLRNAMLRFEPKEGVKVEYIRNGQRKSAQVVLGDPPKLEASVAPNRNPGFGGPDQGLPPNIEEFMRDFQPPQGERVPRSQGDRPVLGVGIETVGPTQRTQYGIPESVSGAVVTQVAPGSMAERLGLKVGDVIREFGGKPIKDAPSFVAEMRTVRPGDKKSIKFGTYKNNAVAEVTRDVQF